MLEAVGPELWHDQFDFIAPLGVHFRGRMTVVRLPGDKLWLHSPIPVDDALAQQLASLGEVAHLVAPNAFHFVHFEAVAARYPNARRWISPALAEKRPTLEFDEGLGTSAPDDWAAALDQHRVQGAPRLDEVVFFHRPSKTLLLTDLVFNIMEYRGWVSGLVFRMAGTHRCFAQSRLVRTMVRDRRGFAASARRILEWDFSRVAMAHGEIIERDAHARLSEAFGWMLDGDR